jgi:hypothetical protein
MRKRPKATIHNFGITATGRQPLAVKIKHNGIKPR